MTPSEMLRLQRDKAATRKPKLISRSKVPFPDGFKAWINETHEMLQGPGCGSYAAIRETFLKYVKRKKLNIPDPIAYLDDAICEGIKRARGSANGYCATPVMGSPAYQLIQRYHSDPRGPKGLRRGPHGRDAYHWKALHLAALDGKMNSDFLENFSRAIGCGSCKSSWKTIMRNMPPDYSDPFGWSVKSHNAVSRKLSPPKKEITVEDARQIWIAT